MSVATKQTEEVLDIITRFLPLKDSVMMFQNVMHSDAYKHNASFRTTITRLHAAAAVRYAKSEVK